MSKKSNNSREWRKEMFARGKGIRMRKKDSPPTYSPELIEVLERTAQPETKIESENQSDLANDADIIERTREQDLKFWGMVARAESMTREWKNYGRKHWDRIRSEEMNKPSLRERE